MTDRASGFGPSIQTSYTVAGCAALLAATSQRMPDVRCFGTDRRFDYKAEVICRRGPWRSYEALEFATL